MITPLGFALRVLFISVFGFIGFVAFGCFVLWASLMVMNWLSVKREEMEEFRKSEEYKEDIKECEDKNEKVFTDTLVFVKKTEEGKNVE